jgi:ribose transport system substrate-binding protein
MNMYRSKNIHRRTKSITAAAAVTIVLALATTGCTSTGNSSGGAATGGPGLTTFADKVNADVKAALAKQTEAVPATGPKAVKGKSVVIVAPGGSSQEGAYRLSHAAQDAAESMGWKVTYINANTDVGQMNAAIQKAIAIGADGVITLSIDGSVLLSALQQAHAAGIKLVGVAAANSDGETGVYDALVPNVGLGESDGYLMGQQAYKATGGHIHSLDMSAQGYGYIDARERGWEKFMKDCQEAGGDCKIEQTVKFSAGDIVTKLPQLTASAARSNSDWNVLWSGFDSGISFMEQGIQQAGLTKENAIAVGFDGNTPNLEQIRKGGFQSSTMGLPTVCLGYAAVDNINRLFAGSPVLDGPATGCKSKLLELSNVPTSGPWWGDADPRPSYWKLWGVEAPSQPTDVSKL